MRRRDPRCGSRRPSLAAPCRSPWRAGTEHRRAAGASCRPAGATGRTRPGYREAQRRHRRTPAMSDKPTDATPPLTKATRAHKDVDTEQDEHKRREFMHAMLADLRALDRMLREGWFETGQRRIGAEQEMFLVDRNWAPARASLRMLDKLADPHYTTELGLF